MVHLPSRLKPAFTRKSSLNPDIKGNDAELRLHVSIVQARDLTAKDRSGASDPYLILKFNNSKYCTKVIKKDLNPQWNEEAQIVLKPGSSTYRLEAICWDHDKFSRKDYLGEFNINLKHYFRTFSPLGSQAQSRWFTLRSYRSGRKSSNVSGSVEMKLWLEDAKSPDCSEADLLAHWTKFTHILDNREGSSFANAPPERPVGMQMADDVDDNDTLQVQDAAADYEESDGDTAAEVDSDLEELSEVETAGSLDSATKRPGLRQRRRERKLKKRPPFHFKSASSQDVLGVVFLEIESATDLPRERNLTKTGFDMDPFVITSFSKKSFRTRVVRHSLNPVFRDKLLLQVHRHESQYSMKFTVVDRDKLSGNDYVGDCEMQIQDLMQYGPQADPETGLYTLAKPEPNVEVERKRIPSIKMLKRTGTSNSLKDEPPCSCPPSRANSDVDISLEANHSEVLDAMRTFSLPLKLARKDFWGDKHNPTLQFKAKFVPYPALRQQFWRVILRHYDADETGDISKVELTTMLDSLGATLRESTIDSFFRRFNGASPIIGTDAQPHIQSLTIDQCVICLEDQLNKTKVLKTDSKGSSSSSSRPPSVDPASTTSNLETVVEGSSQAQSPTIRTNSTPPNEDTLAEHESQEEYLITLTKCPLCQRSNMDRKSAVDIVTHLATCASQDWRKIDHLVMGDFVTSSQAQRKWYTKIISKVGYGGYKLGANSANILVQDRKTGQIQEERMSVYVRLGIRLLYKGLKSSRMESARIKRMLKSLSVKQGRKYDAPLSAKDIPSFIAFHQLDMTEVLDPLPSFKSFNEFFYRKLKPGMRPCTEPNDPRIAVSPADCRSVVFNNLTDATQIWVKGQNFSIKQLIGGAYPNDVPLFENGAFGIFRLAPQDYHRFHIPVDGVLGEPKSVGQDYYTVNPMAIRSNLDVYGENVRVCVPMDTEQFGRVMIVCVGAMMVGSTVITATPGQAYKRTDELGYFKFGGSTILLIFQHGKFVFDEDLTSNAKLSIETLLRVGSSIGHIPGIKDAVNEIAKGPISEAEKIEASRRISGAFLPINDSLSDLADHARETLSLNKVM